VKPLSPCATTCLSNDGCAVAIMQGEMDDLDSMDDSEAADGSFDEF
jgi:hypothetical protein